MVRRIDPRPRTFNPNHVPIVASARASSFPSSFIYRLLNFPASPSSHLISLSFSRIVFQFTVLPKLTHSPPPRSARCRSSHLSSPRRPRRSGTCVLHVDHSQPAPACRPLTLESYTQLRPGQCPRTSSANVSAPDTYARPPPVVAFSRALLQDPHPDAPPINQISHAAKNLSSQSSPDLTPFAAR